MTTLNFEHIMRDITPALEGVLFYGDPHSNWEPLLKSVDQHHPHTVIILGDLIDKQDKDNQKAHQTARDVLDNLCRKGIDVRLISGNHDVDSPAVYDLVFKELTNFLFDGGVIEIGPNKLRIAGLGGVFRGKCWYPYKADETAKVKYHSPEDLLVATRETARFRTGIPLRHRNTIFPSTVRQFQSKRADVLITHEGPTTHERGFPVVDNLAADLGAKLIVYGHHHTPAEACLKNHAIAIRGMGKAEVWKPE
ncbi:MAG: metallophosphoesterase [Tateyamaria sp.]|nr:metallophosphoesterase [Tateyamaria sp.]